MSEVNKYPVRAPLKDKGMLYKAGELVELTPELAEPLIKAGVLGQPVKDAAKPAKGGAGS